MKHLSLVILSLVLSTQLRAAGNELYEFSELVANNTEAFARRFANYSAYRGCARDRGYDRATVISFDCVPPSSSYSVTSCHVVAKCTRYTGADYVEAVVYEEEGAEEAVLEKAKCPRGTVAQEITKSFLYKREGKFESFLAMVKCE